MSLLFFALHGIDELTQQTQTSYQPHFTSFTMSTPDKHDSDPIIPTPALPPATIDPFHFPAYLHRINLSSLVPALPLAPTYRTLRTLQTAHQRSIPWENLAAYRHQSVSLDPSALWTKMVTHKRGGWCYEQNALFERAARQVGFEVFGCAARVVATTPRDGMEHANNNNTNDTTTTSQPVLPPTHKVLVVTCPDTQKQYLIDLGFGAAGAPRMPLEITDGAEDVDPDTGDAYKLVAGTLLADTSAKWGPPTFLASTTPHPPPHLHPATSTGFYLLYRAPATPTTPRPDWTQSYFFSLSQPICNSDCDMLNWYVATSPTITLSHKPMCMLATPTGRVTLYDTKVSTVTRGAELAEALKIEFGIVEGLEQ
ncbi:hypothetical protein DFJ77DRAFT_458423 [Powellomyces hirtus]|nr:hypothetical protein DFJ77DRAFT_458423 [Powellomyces hirtus]